MGFRLEKLLEIEEMLVWDFW